MVVVVHGDGGGDGIIIGISYFVCCFQDFKIHLSLSARDSWSKMAQR